jgi:uncharacterized membrane protein
MAGGFIDTDLHYGGLALSPVRSAGKGQIMYSNLFREGDQIMQDQKRLISAAITGVLTLGIMGACGTASAADVEKCFGIAKAGQNACNSNASKHSCAGHSKIDNDPNDFTPVPKGSCLKIGGKLEPATNTTAAAEKH